jgi:hypothetical protein
MQSSGEDVRCVEAHDVLVESGVWRLAPGESRPLSAGRARTAHRQVLREIAAWTAGLALFSVAVLLAAATLIEIAERLSELGGLRARGAGAEETPFQ